jgi:hypothetical protein
MILERVALKFIKTWLIKKFIIDIRKFGHKYILIKKVAEW